MRPEDEYMFKLLDEISEACKKKKTKYYLIGTELLYHDTGRRVPSCIADVCMTFASYKMIHEELETNPERLIESAETNDDIPGAYYRYVATDTFMIQPEYHKVLKEKGIAVNIHIIRGDSAESKKLCSAEDIMENGIEGVKNKTDASLKRAIGKEKKEGHFGAWITELLSKAALSDISQKSIIKIPGNGVFSFPEGFWEKEEIITVEGRQYSSLAEPELFLSQCYGEGYKNIKYRSTRENFRVMSDATISYREITDDLFEQPDFDKEFWNRRKRFLDHFYYDWAGLNDGVRERENVIYFQRSRFFLWKKYFFVKSKLRELFKEERFDELKMIFWDYERHIKMHLPYDQVPFFDKEIWDIFIKTLHAQGESDAADIYEKVLSGNTIDELSSDRLKVYYKDNDPEETIKMRKL